METALMAGYEEEDQYFADLFNGLETETYSEGGIDAASDGTVGLGEVQGPTRGPSDTENFTSNGTGVPSDALAASTNTPALSPAAHWHEGPLPLYDHPVAALDTATTTHHDASLPPPVGASEMYAPGLLQQASYQLEHASPLRQAQPQPEYMPGVPGDGMMTGGYGPRTGFPTDPYQDAGQLPQCQVGVGAAVCGMGLLPGHHMEGWLAQSTVHNAAPPLLPWPFSGYMGPHWQQPSEHVLLLQQQGQPLQGLPHQGPPTVDQQAAYRPPYNYNGPSCPGQSFPSQHNGAATWAPPPYAAPSAAGLYGQPSTTSVGPLPQQAYTGHLLAMPQHPHVSHPSPHQQGQLPWHGHSPAEQHGGLETYGSYTAAAAAVAVQPGAAAAGVGPAYTPPKLPESALERGRALLALYNQGCAGYDFFRLAATSTGSSGLLPVPGTHVAALHLPCHASLPADILKGRFAEGGDPTPYHFIGPYELDKGTDGKVKICSYLKQQGGWTKAKYIPIAGPAASNPAAAEGDGGPLAPGAVYLVDYENLQHCLEHHDIDKHRCTSAQTQPPHRTHAVRRQFLVRCVAPSTHEAWEAQSKSRKGKKAARGSQGSDEALFRFIVKLAEGLYALVEWSPVWPAWYAAYPPASLQADRDRRPAAPRRRPLAAATVAGALSQARCERQVLAAAPEGGGPPDAGQAAHSWPPPASSAGGARTGPLPGGDLGAGGRGALQSSSGSKDERATAAGSGGTGSGSGRSCGAGSPSGSCRAVDSGEAQGSGGTCSAIGTSYSADGGEDRAHGEVGGDLALADGEGERVQRRPRMEAGAAGGAGASGGAAGRAPTQAGADAAGAEERIRFFLRSSAGRSYLEVFLKEELRCDVNRMVALQLGHCKGYGLFNIILHAAIDLLEEAGIHYVSPDVGKGPNQVVGWPVDRQAEVEVMERKVVAMFELILNVCDPHMDAAKRLISQQDQEALDTPLHTCCRFRLRDTRQWLLGRCRDPALLLQVTKDRWLPLHTAARVWDAEAGEGYLRRARELGLFDQGLETQAVFADLSSYNKFFRDTCAATYLQKAINQAFVDVEASERPRIFTGIASPNHLNEELQRLQRQLEERLMISADRSGQQGK